MEQEVKIAARGVLPLRDIAAYWGAKCYYATHLTKNPGWDTGWPIVDGSTMEDLADKAIYHFKLYLRPIEKITDAEVTQIAPYLPEEVQGNTSKEFLRIYEERHLGMSSNQDAVEWGGAITAYLQRQGIYVPGTIDSELVELI